MRLTFIICNGFSFLFWQHPFLLQSDLSRKSTKELLEKARNPQHHFTTEMTEVDDEGFLQNVPQRISSENSSRAPKNRNSLEITSKDSPFFFSLSLNTCSFLAYHSLTAKIIYIHVIYCKTINNSYGPLKIVFQMIYKIYN